MPTAQTPRWSLKCDVSTSLRRAVSGLLQLGLPRFRRISCGPPTYPIDVVVFDDDGPGGAPGTLLGELNGQTATTHVFRLVGGQPPIWNSYDISSLAINVTSGSVYIGTRYVPPPPNSAMFTPRRMNPLGIRSALPVATGGTTSMACGRRLKTHSRVPRHVHTRSRSRRRWHCARSESEDAGNQPSGETAMEPG